MKEYPPEYINSVLVFLFMQYVAIRITYISVCSSKGQQVDEIFTNGSPWTPLPCVKIFRKSGEGLLREKGEKLVRDVIRQKRGGKLSPGSVASS